jgi:hypothetical protein
VRNGGGGGRPIGRARRKGGKVTGGPAPGKEMRRCTGRRRKGFPCPGCRQPEGGKDREGALVRESERFSGCRAKGPGPLPGATAPELRPGAAGTPRGWL